MVVKDQGGPSTSSSDNVYYNKPWTCPSSRWSFKSLAQPWKLLVCPQHQKSILKRGMSRVFRNTKSLVCNRIRAALKFCHNLCLATELSLAHSLPVISGTHCGWRAGLPGHALETEELPDLAGIWSEQACKLADGERTIPKVRCIRCSL